MLMGISSKPEVAGDEGSSSARRPAGGRICAVGRSSECVARIAVFMFSQRRGYEVLALCIQAQHIAQKVRSVAEPLFGHEQPLFGRGRSRAQPFDRSLAQEGSVEKPSAPGR